jgi:hypothetical protein
MGYYKFIDRIKRVDYFLRCQQTGTAKEFGEKLGVSRRTVFEYLDFIKTKGAEISFNKITKTYFYKIPFLLIL